MVKANNSAPPLKADSENPRDAMRSLRNSMVQSTFLITALVGIPAVAAALVNTLKFGWESANVVYIGALLLAWTMVLFGKRVSLPLRLGIIFIALFVIGLYTLSTWGLVGSGFFWFILLCMLAVIYSGRTIGFVALGVTVVTVVLVGLAIQYRWIIFATDFNIYAVSYSTWFVALFSFCLVVAVIIDALGRLLRFLFDSVSHLHQQRMELQSANEALTASGKHLRNLIDTSPVGMALSNEKGVLDYVNKKFVDIFGYPAEEIRTHQDWIEKAYPDKTYRKTVEKMWAVHTAESIEKNIEMKPIEAVVTCKNGNKRTIEFRRSFIGQRNVITCNDITERKTSENELRRLRNLLGSIIDSMESIIIGVDRDIVVTQWNKQAAAVTGNSTEQALGRPLAEVFPKIASELGWVKTAIESGKITGQNKVPVPIGNEIRYWNATNYPIVEDQVVGAVIRVDDVTDQVHLEETLVQSEKMMSVGQLAAGMAHEINNPLAGILQNAELLRVRLTEQLAKNKQAAEACGITMDDIVCFGDKRNIPQAIEHLTDAGTRAARIVENMLSFARRSESVKAPGDLRTLLDATIELCKTDYDLKRRYDFLNIDIKKEYEADVPSVLCEPTEIQQVFLNILKNGAEAMNLVGAIDPPTARAPADGDKKPLFVLRIKQHGEMARVEIEDNGPGMDPNTRKRIFEPFFTSKEVGVGTGLGLSVSYFIITNNHNGNLAVESMHGRGTKFIIDLPIA